MDTLRIALAGPGRAGGSILLAAHAAGHEIVGVYARNPDAIPSGMRSLAWDEPVPGCDVLVVATRDGAIAEVAERLAPLAGRAGAACHLSGFTPLSVLAPLGPRTGSLHPLQTLPDPRRGADALYGAHAAVTADDPEVASLLTDLASSLGMRPFGLPDRSKPAYHAGAAAASNYVVEALAVAADLLERAGVPLEAARPLTERIVANCFEDGPAVSLTGPVARADEATVAGHLRAAAEVSGDLAAQVRSLAEATALRAGTHDRLAGLWEPA